MKAPWDQMDALGFPVETKYRALTTTQFWVDVIRERVWSAVALDVHVRPGESKAAIKWELFTSYLRDWTTRGRALVAQMRPGDQIYAYDYMGFMGPLSGAEGYVLVRGGARVAEITGSVS